MRTYSKRYDPNGRLRPQTINLLDPRLRDNRGEPAVVEVHLFRSLRDLREAKAAIQKDADARRLLVFETYRYFLLSRGELGRVYARRRGENLPPVRFVEHYDERKRKGQFVYDDPAPSH